MSVRINPVPDVRAERMLADPAKYFAEARAEIRAQVEREMADEAADRKRCRWRKQTTTPSVSGLRSRHE
jgi:hypothetical protein